MYVLPPLDLTTQQDTGLALFDASLRLQWLNPALGELWSVGPRTAIGQTLQFLARDRQLQEHAARALHEQRSIHLRGVALAGSQASQDVLADIHLQPLATSQLLLEVHALAENALAATPLSATLRGFAHEVKNPLAALRGAAQLLERRVAHADLKKLARLVMDEADRLAALADGLLRQRAGAPQLTRINVHELLERVGALMQAQPEPLRLRHDYDPSLPEVRGDADRLLQVLLNLTRNAREAGARTITLRTRAEHGVRLGEHSQRALRIDVIDDGAGIDEAIRDTLFQPLVSGRADGTGLGLALAREIARDHGGELRCTSPVGETVFSLYLPLDR